ncbi:GTPase HflX [Polystyrenella longa]|uniref:GTPase HflX n=1 Tax=Polystyrenella longa TaxID=2528007 RepID=UPI0011A6A077|nr:GTPase HflX [Polystyrenella longa]
MGDPKREELQVKEKKAVLAGVIDPARRDDFQDPLAELSGLASTANVVECGRMIQYRDLPDMTTCMGPGKVQELKQLCEATEAEIIVFDNNLTPAQGRNLEKELDMVIVDRSELILDIFASNAQTYEAKLQVELAQLLYFRPRLKRLWTHLERIEGGVGAGRGPGEKQLETDRRLIDKRIAELKKKLKEVEKRRALTVGHRRNETTVSLVGYTNAGKSTLMRAVTGADVFVADQLFATLDTRTRRWSLPNWGDVLLSDTVGFVRNLPHHLVASFRSTLEEARMADLLLHVVDASNPEAKQQIETVDKVLEKIDVDCSNMLLVLNKVDRCEDRSLVDVLRAQHENAVVVSAHTGEGIERLRQRITEKLGGGYVDATIETGAGNGKLFSFLAEHSEVTERTYDDENRVQIQCRIPKRFLLTLERKSDEQTTVTVIGGPSDPEFPYEDVEEMTPSEPTL